MGQFRKRFNEKARSGMLAKQAALKRVRSRQFTRHMDDGTKETEAAEPVNPNAEILKPVTDAEKDERKRKMTEELFGPKETKVSRSKKKRMEKYIDHQLKREEKQVLFSKLADTKMDTSLLKSSKLLGTGKQTKKEQFIEALELEAQGRGDAETKETLYEERVVKDWDDSQEFLTKAIEVEEFPSTDTSSFIDQRPAAGGFGFANLPKVEKLGKRSYSWRSKVMAEDAKKKKLEDDYYSSESGEATEMETEESEAESEAERDATEDNEAELDSESGAEEIEEAESNVESEVESDSDSDESESDSPRLRGPSEKAQSFKAWAEQQVRTLEGRMEVTNIPLSSLPEEYQNYKPAFRAEDQASDTEEFIPIDETSTRKAFYVDVDRPNEIQLARMHLPVFGEEHRIMEAIHHHDCVVICGETGSGKTTQVPQFLYEAGYGASGSGTSGMIGITQPRRVAAVSMAERVGKEMGNHGARVGYQVRFDARVDALTKMKFMTDGVLLREMMNDFMLEKYSAIIIDEAHERNINTDILIGMLSRVLKLRAQYHARDPTRYTRLKLVIMSATLRVSDFAENKLLFRTPPPVLKVEARQFPVSVHFNRRTTFNYLDEVFRKTCKIHQKLPPGGILIFLTGQQEIQTVVKRLRKEFPLAKRARAYDEDVAMKVSAKHADTEAEEIDFSVRVNEEEEEEDDYDSQDEEGFEETREAGQTDRDPLYILPLYSLLPTRDQMKVFEEPPAGSRLCIVATNVAETSLTIPGIRYVVDCGRAKERKFNEDTGVQSFEIDWISKASAGQRAGRAGRTGPGHCYRLYSSAVYEQDFVQFAQPEILRMPVESVVLSMKSMGIDTIVNFPFPTPPDRHALDRAEKLLLYLGALDADRRVSELGRAMSLFPLSPRFAKMLIVGNQHACLEYVVAIVSVLSVGEPFLTELELGIQEVKPVGDEDVPVESYREQEAKRALRAKFHQSRRQFARLDKCSDALRLLSAVCAYDHVPRDARAAFLADNFLRPKIMEEVSRLRQQIASIVRVNTAKESIAATVDAEVKLAVPSKVQIAALKQMVASGFVDQVAIRADLVTSESVTNKSNVINIPYLSLFPSMTHGEEVDPSVYIHPGSILTNLGELPPPYLVYQSLNLGSNRVAGKISKLRMRPLTDIGGKPLANIGKSSGLVTYSKPLGHPYAPKNITATKRECYVVPRIGAAIGSGGVGWDLPAKKVVQNRVNGQWVIE
ncbi:hypothetical protein BABINDRAFT_159797 [Babjeviella inositovora NRRL Y-12698]|uniref:RNA helicase n=1 Tax=Babjeviella inositovora NRRL Y-12698 TaxID=984486 RepID=A0A1E3QV26_9ASCO|nr:uncharacterized protein BABINDRAFT_159797 [Babjeviella inositovora NRRL Y-12698]ODQ81516.1 hypothetical protein BABINDRAFT_159797 [Babjeviella inositovora NRRL Y-12698]